MSERATATGTLYLVPVGLGSDDDRPQLPAATLGIAHELRIFVAENAKSARRFLKAVDHPGPIQQITIHLLNEHTTAQEIDALLAPLKAGRDCGVVSEAGCPGVADPGAELVRRAHAAGIRVIPLTGPSSILLALMASGLNGQNFAFHGYLPADKAQRDRRLKEIDERAHGETQIFIETPYRSEAMLRALLNHCRGETLLCLATDLTLPTEFVATRTIAEWEKKPPALARRLAVFLLYRD